MENIKKLIETAKNTEVPKRYNLGLSVLQEIHNCSNGKTLNEKIIDMLNLSFKLGFMRGQTLGNK